MKFFDLWSVISSKSNVVEYLSERGVLRRTLACDCGEGMRVKESGDYLDGMCFWCFACRKKKSIRAGSFFDGARISLDKVVALLYLLHLDVLNKDIAETLDLDEHLVMRYATAIRLARSRALVVEKPRLGGPGVRVQVDETLMAKAKMTRNRHARPVDAQWVLGMVDTSTRVGVMRLIEDRREITMLPYIVEHCLPGSIIVTDGHASYNNVGVLGFGHEVVVHADHFVDPETGVHTNLVENYWQRCKRKFKRIYGTSRRLLPIYLNEFMWMERHGKSLEDRWANTIGLIRHRQ